MGNKLKIALVFVLFVVSCRTRQNIPEIPYSSKIVSEPIPFAEGIISTKENSEFELTFSTDGLKAYFSRRVPGEKQKIYVTSFINGNWTNPLLTEFSTDRDETAHITPNGKFFFFGSERPIPSKPNMGNFDMNIWMMEKANEGWSDPKPLPAPINQVQKPNEEWPLCNNNLMFTNDDKTFYFTTMMRGTDLIKLYQTDFDGQTFSEPIAIEGLFEDDKYWVYSAVISPDGNYLVFNSYDAPNGSGGEDIYISKKTTNGWSTAKPIGPLINTSNEESSPRFSRDGKYFFFARAENLGDFNYGEWDIYYVETRYLNFETIFKQR